MRSLRVHGLAPIIQATSEAELAHEHLHSTESVDGAGVIEAANTSGGSPIEAPDDGSVIEALRRGDKIAFAYLLDHYPATLRRVARLYISNRAVADEVVQDTWLGVIQGMWAFEGRSSL